MKGQITLDFVVKYLILIIAIAAMMTIIFGGGICLFDRCLLYSLAGPV